MEGRVIIRSNLAHLMQQKTGPDGKRLTQHRLQKETGIALNTIKRYLRTDEDFRSFDNNVVSAFCEYFGCQVGDVLKAVDVGESDSEENQNPLL